MYIKILAQKSTSQLLNLGIILLLSGLFVGLVSYLIGYSVLYYIAFFLITIGIFLAQYAMSKDIKEQCNLGFSFFAMLILFIAYILLRSSPLEFVFTISDASDYFWSGISSARHGDDIGFFPPLTASIIAIGYTIFGFDYASMMIVMVFSMTIPLFYFLLRTYKFEAIVSFIFVFFIQIIPVNIWFSKSTFSEAIWHLLILIFIFYTLILSQNHILKWKYYVPFLVLLALMPFTRGSAVILYGPILFLGLYHYWRYVNFKVAFILLLSTVIIALSIHYSLSIRARYLLEWQYSRLIPHLKANTLMMLLYSASLIPLIVLILIQWIKVSFVQKYFPLLIVFFALIFKIGIAYLFSIKKDIAFSTLLYGNEWSFMYGNLGLILASIVVMGIIYMHYSAAKGSAFPLILVVLYAIFMVPFSMQSASFSDEHVILLYWSRYYFSELLIIHMFALAMLVKLFYDFLCTLKIQEKSRDYLFIFLILGTFLFSINFKLLQSVSTEGYLTHSSQLFSWLSKKGVKKNVSIVYSSDIEFNKFNVKKLLYKGLYVMDVKPKIYQQISKDRLNEKSLFSPMIMHHKYLLCISSSVCELNKEKFQYIDTLHSEITWREQKVVQDEDVNTLNIYATLYEIKVKK